MKLTISFLIISAAFYAGATNNGSATSNAILETPVVDGSLRYVLETVLDRFDDMNHRLLDLQYQVSEQREEVEQIRMTNEMSFTDFLWAMHRLEEDVGRNMSVLQDRSMVILGQQKSCANHEKLREELFGNIPKQNLSSYPSQGRTWFSYRSRIPVSPPPTTPAPPTYASCKAAPATISGVYHIRINNASAPLEVYCEQREFGGGWIVMQHRFNGTVNFYLNWTDYQYGFGKLGSEFWLGLEHVHQLTAARKHELLVEVKDFNGGYGYARYNSFQVSSAIDHYSLKSVGSYSGTAGDALQYHVGYKFSTPDRDNDGSSAHYAVSYEAPWWLGANFYSILNGPYQNTADKKSMFWYNLKSDYRGMSFSRMMIREL